MAMPLLVPLASHHVQPIIFLIVAIYREYLQGQQYLLVVLQGVV